MQAIEVVRDERVEQKRQRLEQLGDEIATLAAHIHAATFRLLQLIRQFDEQNGWCEGFCSCAHWLSWRTGIDLGAAREKVRVAKALAALPRISEALQHGRISYAKARAMSRIATPENEAKLLNIAQHGTASHVEKVVRAYRHADPEAENLQAVCRAEGRYVNTHWDEQGMLVLSGKLPPQLGARLLAALDVASDQLRAAEGTAQMRSVSVVASESEPTIGSVRCSPRQRRADALGLLADAAVSGGLEKQPAAGGARLVVHVDAEVLQDGADGRCEIDNGPHLSAETCRRLGCDATVSTIIEQENGEPLSVGRNKRIVSGALRRALDSRDETCRFPGCTHRRFLQAHHIKHWADGGETSLENAVNLCSWHHFAVHEQGFTVERDDRGELVFATPRGHRIAASPQLPSIGSDPVSALAKAHGRSGIEIDASTLSTHNGDRLDLGWAVETLMLS